MHTLKEIKDILGEDYNFKSSKTVDELKQILEGDIVPFENVPFVLEAGNLDIEITIYGDEEHDKPWAGYFCCIRVNGEWESYDEVDAEVNLDTPDLETEMFRVLSEYADKKGLSFFGENQGLYNNTRSQNGMSM